MSKSKMSRLDIVQGVLATIVSDWYEGPNRIKFKVDGELSLKELNALSRALGTDSISLNFGEDGTPALSDVTPGCEGYGGWIEALWPKA